MELKTILDLASEIASSTVKDEAGRSDQHSSWVSESMEALKQAGLMGLVIPKSDGGLGMGLNGLARVCETLGASYASTGLCFGMHCVGSAVIAAKATAWQKENYLQPIVAGKHITTLALSEPGTGAHFYFPQTEIAEKDDGLVVNGEKTFVTNGSHADSYVISTMAVDSDAPPDQFSCAVMDGDSKGVKWGDKWEGLGMRGNSSRSMKLENVKLSRQHILGENGDQLWYVFNVIAPYFLTAMAGTYLGVAGAAFREAKDAVYKRSYAHSGSKLSQVTVVQHRLGELYEKWQAARSLIYHAASEGDRGSDEALTLIFSSKTIAARCAVDLANEAMTLAGGVGYRGNSTLGRLLRDARAAHVMAPTTDVLYTWSGRALLDQPLLSD